MTIQEERWRLLLRSFSDGNVLTITRLQHEAKVSHNVLSPGYGLPGADTVERIARGAAVLLLQVVGLRIDQGSLLAWLYGADVPDLDAQLIELPELRRCVKCQRLFHRTDFVRATGRCKNCHNQTTRERHNPRAAKFRQLILSSLAALRRADPPLAAAVNTVLADPSAAITGPQIERASGGEIRAKDFSRRLQLAVGLNKRAIPLAMMLALLATGTARSEIRHQGLRPAGRRRSTRTARRTPRRTPRRASAQTLGLAP